MKSTQVKPWATLDSRLLLVTAALLWPCLSGCINPQLVNSATSSLYPTAPGDTRFLLVRVINNTTATLDVPIAYDDGTNPTPYLIADLTPQGREAGVLIEWPVLSLNVGNLDSPWVPSIIASFSDGTTLAIPAQKPTLVAEKDFFQGDTIIYQFTADARSPAAINVSVGRINGSTQEGPFTREDTFEVVQVLLQVNGFIGGTVIP